MSSEPTRSEQPQDDPQVDPVAAAPPEEALPAGDVDEAAAGSADQTPDHSDAPSSPAEAGSAEDGSRDAPADPGEPGLPAAAEEALAEGGALEDEDDDQLDASIHVEPIEEDLGEEEEGEEDSECRWYILKVQVNRENTIRDAMLRGIKRYGLEGQIAEIVVPTEDVVEFTKSGNRRTVQRKLYPGYIMVNMVLNDETWFLVRETPGIGDFTGSAGKPTPMLPEEVARIIKAPAGEEEEESEEVRIAIPFANGDRVRVKEGYFQNFEGEVESIDETNGRVTVIINIFGRSTPVELQHWQMESL